MPDRIIIYRDGVSEGQYTLVREKELPRIQAAFAHFAKSRPYRPLLSILICGKRHHARFPATAKEHMTKNGNTLPGTVCDKGVTDIYNHDFYLQAHNGLQGTVRPTHYVVVHDENKLSADTVQALTHNFSYMFARATKAVSLVPPAYYADIACERAREYLSTLMRAVEPGSSVSKGSEAERAQVYEEALKQWGNGIHANLKETMFYI